MSCTNITTCYEVGTTYKDRFLNFPDDLDGLTDFRYVVKSALGATLLTLTEGNGIERLGANNMCLQSAQLQDLDPGTYSTTFFYKLNGNDRKLFTETLEISIDGCDCANVYNLSFTIIPVDIEENVVNIYLSWEDLTPAQILELQQPAIDAGNEVRQQVNEYIEAAQLAENTRISNENERIGAENDRQAWEDERDENEDERILNESERVSAENTRKSAENTRISNESTRQSQESTRQTNESERVNAEGTRVSAENTRISNENTRQNQESTRQTNENTRVSNESARVLAESARVTASANAVTNANNAADNANNAASFANSQRGWTPIHEFESDGAQRQVKKLVDYIGGTGTKPTQNIGEYVTDGGYTTDKSLATNFKGDYNNGQTLIVDYIVTGIEHYIKDVIINDGIITKSEHGFVNGDTIVFRPNLYDRSKSNVLSIRNYYSVPTGIDRGIEYYVVNATPNQFQLSATSSGSPIIINGNNFNCFLTKIEDSIININDIFSSKIKIVILGNVINRRQNNNYLSISINGMDHRYSESIGGPGVGVTNSLSNTTDAMYSLFSETFHEVINGEVLTTGMSQYYTMSNNSITYNSIPVLGRTSGISDINTISNIVIRTNVVRPILSGTRIKIYKIE